MNPLLAVLPLLSPTAPRQQPEFRRGAIYGRIEDFAGVPIPGATVAVESPAGKVLAWGKTDRDGRYALDADPKIALAIKDSDRTLFEQCARALGDLVMTPIRLATEPVQTARSAVESLEDHNPGPLVGEATQAAMPNPTNKKPTAQEGQAELVVLAPGFKDADVTPNARWCEAPEYRGLGLRAWMETVKMAPLSGISAPQIEDQTLKLASASASPLLVSPGGFVEITARLNHLPDFGHPVRVFARESRKGLVTELKVTDDGRTFFGTMTLGERFPSGRDAICIAALRAAPVGLRLSSGGADPFPMFVRRLAAMKATKPFRYDPTIMASKNREELKVTILPNNFREDSGD